MNEIVICKNLSKIYENGKGLKEVSIKIPRGRIVGLLGSNGSGKTTLLKLLNGMLVPDSGEILIDGKKPGVETKKIVSYLPERNSLMSWMQVDELIQYYNDFYQDFDRRRAIDLVRIMDIDRKAKMKALSKGMKEKIQLILCMCRQSMLYCLDEPIGGVDPAAREYIIDTILKHCNSEATILISTHMIADVENILEDIIFIKNGIVIQSGAVEQIKKQEKAISMDELFRRMYKC